ncbi:alpha/beta hydrolase [Clostridium sp. CX1]|uniref:alpha/beta fold hydrolase n=1 Tax=Clostridium sp. CX1 TaxID=2978346 RepID=UPI0021BEA37E|nr:alpha/beta hydrolase [Clostridium sp. CX1]MCT8975183.1 alpha/beta hydrolase [Clostridium sp. CX1]
MNLETKKDKRKIKLIGVKRFRKYVFRALICTVIILLIGFSYEKIGEYTDVNHYPPVGKMVDVNNHKINVYSKGEGKITVVFGSGLNTPSAYSDFYPIYNEILKYAKIVTYDRPGHGWSEVTDEPRDIDTIVKEMHTALEKSGQKPPYILVGHSYASLQAIRFAQTYKNEVSGVMLIDGVNPEYYAKNGSEISSGTVAKYKFLKSVGIARLILNHTDLYSKNFKSLPDDLEQLYFGMFLKTMFNKNIVEEGKMGKASAKLIIANGHLGNLPLRILSAPSDTEWNDSQVALKEWSKDSEQIVVNGARHAIHQSNPEVVSEQIKKLLENNK